MHSYHEKKYSDTYGQHSSHRPHCEMIEYQCEPQDYPNPAHIICSKQFTIHEKLVVPCAKPDIEELLEVKAYPYIEKCKVINTPFGHKLIIIGRVEQKIVYVADVPCQSVHVFHATEPFCIFFEMPHDSCCSSGHHSHPSSAHVWPSGNYQDGSLCTSSSSCHSSSPHHHKQQPPSPSPHVLLEFLCAQHTGPREVSKCMVLMIWFPHDMKPPGPPPSPKPPVPCEEQHDECCSCKYSDCPYKK